MSIRIIIADDHKLFLEGLVSLLSQEEDISVVATATDGLQALKAARKVRADVAVIDVSMPVLNGLETTRKIIDELPDIHVICVSMHGGSEYVVPALEHGASGYLLKECASEELVQAIRCVSQGMKYLSPSVAGEAVSGLLSRGSETPATRHGLTGRELEVLQLIAEDCTTNEAARKLHVSVKTVATHRANIVKKIGVRGVAGLTRFAIHHRIISEDYTLPGEPRAED